VLREVAEYPNAYVELRPGQERIETERYTLCLDRGLHAATVQRQRFAAVELDDVLAEVRGLLRARGRTRTQWEVGSTARPFGLTAMLLARGLTQDGDGRAIAFSLNQPPPPPPPGLAARRVLTAEEFAQATDVQEIAFGSSPEQRAAWGAAAREEWETGPPLMHAVWDGDTIIAAGACAPTPHGLALFGGAVLPSHRGRGAYRALIAARWQEAAGRGIGALVTQAGPMSLPILVRIGFAGVGHVDMLVDDFGAADAGGSGYSVIGGG
jgi:GNAT superfamily N-acetyltransferase